MAAEVSFIKKTQGFVRARVGFTLIELLAVIAVISMLVVLTTPILRLGAERSRVTRAYTEVGSLALAMTAYLNAYHVWGEVLPEHDQVNIEVMEYLGGENERSLLFMEFPARAVQEQRFVDPWGNEYRYAIDDDYDNEIEAMVGDSLVTVYRPVAVWSEGPPDGSAITSWGGN